MEHILLTGFPGFIAECLIERCLEEKKEIFWHFIVLPGQIPNAFASIKRMKLDASRYRLYSGNIADVGLGLLEKDIEGLRHSISRCYHLAALYDLTASASDTYVANVVGTRNVLDFLETCPNLKKFNYVSTCYVSGKQVGPIEEDVLGEGVAFRNEYERTKHEAERIVRERMHKLPTTIYRPAVVVGDSRTGGTNKYDGPYVLISFLKAVHRMAYLIPNLGFNDSWFNSVPVDFVAAVLRDVGLSDAFIGKTLQIADPAPATTEECFDAILFQITGRQAIRIPRFLRGLILKCLKLFPFDLMTGIPSHTIDYFEHRGRFRTNNLEKACEAFKIPLPDWRQVYAKIVKFSLKHARPFPNAALVRQFRWWCYFFRPIYFVLALIFIFAPGLVTRLLTLLDSESAAALLIADHPLWRTLSISFVVGLFVMITSLEYNPFQKPLHIIVIAVKAVSSVLFLWHAVWDLSVALFVCAVIDGIIFAMHWLFYIRLRSVQKMSGGEFSWNPYDILFPDRFVYQFCASMVPELPHPIDIPKAVEGVKAHVKGLPLHERFAFVFCVYYFFLVLPILVGYPPYAMMSEKMRQAYFRKIQHMRQTHVMMPVIFVKMICAIYVFRQKPYLASIGAM